LIDPQCSGGSNNPASACNRVRDTSDTGTNKSLGTLSLRRRFTNKTGLPVTQLRFRLVDITTKPAPAGTADLRVLSSGTVTLTRVDGTTVVVQGTTLETPPAQAMGGGLNSALVVTIPGGVLAPNAPIDVQLVSGVEQGGSFRFLVNVEAVTGTGVNRLGGNGAKLTAPMKPSVLPAPPNDETKATQTPARVQPYVLLPLARAAAAATSEKTKKARTRTRTRAAHARKSQP
jgi:hypothetical protein